MDHDHHDNHDNMIELPEPTGWPIVAAFGLTLLFFGLVTDMVISIVGLVVGLIGAVGWFKDVFPHPRHEYVPIKPIEEQPKPIRTAGRVVQILEEGHVPNRAHIPQQVHPYSVGVWAGLVAGAVMAVLACGFGLVYYGSLWYPVNLLAAAGVPDLAHADKAVLMSFRVDGLIVGTIAHVTLSLMIGLLYAALVPMLPRRREWIYGGLIAPILWTLLIYVSLRLVDPALEKAINWYAFTACQIIFGLICGWVVYRSGKMDTMQSWSLPQRLGVEAQHRTEEDKKS